MKKGIYVRLLAFMLVLGCSSFVMAQEYAPNQVIVKLKPGASPAVLANVAAPGAMHSAPVSRSAGGARLITLNEGVAVTSAVALLSANPDIEYAEPNWLVYATAVPNDPLEPVQWAWEKIQAYEAWDLETGDASVVVSMIDSGIDTDHEDLAGNLWTNALEAGGTTGVDDDGNGYVDDIHGWNTIDDNGNLEDDFGHGTHVAGTIGAVTNNLTGVAGTNWTSSLLPCRFMTSPGIGTLYNGIECFDYIIATRDNPASNADVRIASNSWATGLYSKTLKNAIQSLVDEGILWVSATANEGSDLDCLPFGAAPYPSGYDIDGIIAVTNTTSTDELETSANYGASVVDIGAPGTWIRSTFLHSTYMTLTGTSMAAPHVAGVAALVLARNPSISMTGLREAILCTGDPIPALYGKTRTGMRLNALGAVNAALSGATCNDRDSDGTPDYADNCPYDANDQTDSDGNGVGDECEPIDCGGGC